MNTGKKAKDNDASAKQAPGRRQKMRRHVFVSLVVLIALGAIALSIFFGSSFSFRAQFLVASESQKLKSMTDAKLACDKKVEGKFGRLLQLATLNNASSRYDDDFGGYQLVYDVSVYRDKERDSGVRQVMYKCHIYNDGDVREKGVIQSTRTPGKASQETDENIFGF
jgi:hypothetical protein